MTWESIAKHPESWTVPPNLRDYAAMCAGFAGYITPTPAF